MPAGRTVSDAQRVSSRRFIDAMTARKFGPWLGVPCSFLRPFIDRVIDSDGLDYVASTNEGEALAMAVGAQLAGRRPVVMLQNSGLGNLVNPLASLTYPFRVPVLLIITLRGDPSLRDEPQHELMGRTTRAMLDLLEVENEWFPSSDAEIEPRIDRALERMGKTGLPYAFILKKNVVDAYDPRPRSAPPPRPRGVLHAPVPAGEALSRSAAVALLAETVGDRTAIIATTGKTGRELFEFRDRPTHFYVVGSMGCASSIALGVARYRDVPVMVLDGDGAALMRLEALAGIGSAAPPEFIHVILDNQSYDSTGGQATISASVNFPEIAIACGYASACSVTSPDAIRAALARAKAAPGPHLLHVHVGLGAAAGLGRPDVAPREVAERFRAALAAL
ncbi:MAG TPA: phosphonopyruvate decarboxylase [Gemmatimonadaceae bacterium]